MNDEGREVRRTGIGMMLLFWLLFIAAGTWWFHGYVERQRNPNSHLVSAVAEGEPLVLERSRGGHFVATGRINGEPVEFLVDTGATYVALPQEMAERLGLESTGSAWFNTANGRVRGGLTILDEVFNTVADVADPLRRGKQVNCGVVHCDRCEGKVRAAGNNRLQLAGRLRERINCCLFVAGVKRLDCFASLRERRHRLINQLCAPFGQRVRGAVLHGGLDLIAAGLHSAQVGRVLRP